MNVSEGVHMSQCAWGGWVSEDNIRHSVHREGESEDNICQCAPGAGGGTTQKITYTHSVYSQRITCHREHGGHGG